MSDCHIVCAGGFCGLLKALSPDDYLIAADGGFAHLKALGIAADVALGDFDSLGYVPENAQVFPVKKDDTDAMLAVRHGLSLGYDRFLIYGGLDGQRLEHTVANFQTLQFLADRNAKGYLIGQNQIATVVKNSAIAFSARATGYISVFCLGADARGVTLTGLEYPLENATLTAGFPLGVSNRFTGKSARIQVTDGSLLVIYHRTNGLPEDTQC